MVTAVTVHSSNVFTEYFEGLLEPRYELRHISQHLILVRKTVGQFRFQIREESVCLSGCVGLKVVEELVRQISVLRQHVIKVLQALFARFTFIVNLLMHLVTLVGDISNDLFLVLYTSFLLNYEAIFYAFELRTYRI